MHLRLNLPRRAVTWGLVLSGEKYAEVVVSAKVVNIKFLHRLILVFPSAFHSFSNGSGEQ